MKKFTLIVLLFSGLYAQNLSFTQVTDGSFPINISHQLVLVSGSDGSSFSDIDFEITDPYDYCHDFNLTITKNDIADLTVGNTLFILNEYCIDMDNDGNWEQGWTDANTKVISHSYPEPTGGIASATIKIGFKYVNQQNGYTTTVYRTITITTYSDPEIYINNNLDHFVKLTGSSDNNHIPLLFVEGFDPLNVRNTAFYYGMADELVSDYLSPNDYTTFILNFADGGGDMRDNAQVLQNALNKINAMYPDRMITLVGLSMGGVISRYMLSKMEYEGQEHNVGTFISYDSPQQGANINYELQSLISAVPAGKNETLVQLHQSLGCMAAKQLLVKNAFDVMENNGHGVEFNSFYNEMNNYGYPENCYNIAVSNGAFTTTYNGSQINEDLFTISGELAEWLGGNSAGFSISPTATDIGVGSMTDLGMKNGMNMFARIGPFTVYLASVGISINFDPIFIPTFSSLDLQGVEFDASYNIISYVSTPFDKIIYQDQGYNHPEVTEYTISELMTEMISGDVDVTLKNEYHGDNIEGSYLSVIGVNNSVLSNSSVSLVNQAYYEITTNHAPTNHSIWFHHWNNDESDFQFKKTITAEHGLPPQYSKFDDVEIVHVEPFSSENIQLRDPWRISNPDAENPADWIQPNSFQSVSGSYDVFLNQYPSTDPNIGLPIYSLKAPRYYADTEHIYEFQRWKATDSSGDTVSVDNSAFIWVVSKNSLTSEVVFKQAGV
jgi:triacylglycerol esterase/lipase EstA (alpha/beta hydrolase family)